LPGDGWAFEILLILALAAHFHGQPGKMAIYGKPGKPGFFMDGQRVTLANWPSRRPFLKMPKAYADVVLCRSSDLSGSLGLSDVDR